jgi:peptidoglycan hydrolase-like protein with peptidoglycan-binding domain
MSAVSASIARSPRSASRRVLVRGACALTLSGLTLGIVPPPVMATPIAIQAPLLPSIVGVREGARGSDVRTVQNALIAAGVRVPGGADGIFGPATKSALTAFQSRSGLAPTGEVDGPTAAALGLAQAAPDVAPADPAAGGLTHGSRGPQVAELQRALMAAGVYLPGGADGVFGNATRTAVSNFQRWNQLPVTGTVDAATASRLRLGAVPATSPTPPPPPPAPTPPPAPAAPAPGGSSLVGLATGARGDNVRALQRALIAAGITVRGGADGVFGAMTAQAVTAFQQARGLPATGTVDQATADALGQPAPPTPPPPPPAPTPPPAAAPAPGGSSLVGLATGARGDNVRALQRALIAAGITVRGGADGVFGAMTAQAVTAFQQARGLPATGTVDQATADALGQPAPPTPPPPPPAPTPPAADNPYAGLAMGATGDRVRELQRALMGTGLVLRGGADGVFGNATRAALMAFQRTNGTPQTGVLTAQEARVLGLGSSSTPQAVAPTIGHPVFGERGPRVVALQNALLATGIRFAGGADGVFGAATTGAILEFQRRSGLPATGRLDDETANRLGTAAAPAPAPPSAEGVTLDVFPVQGRCWFGDTWHAPRGGGRLHLGTDVIAPRGNLLYAVTSGTITRIWNDFPGSTAGNGVRLQQDNGTYFVYLHMDTFAPDITVGTTVTAGQVLGTVGATGNTTTPHLHFEVNPRGAGHVNPFPLLRQIDACNVTAPRA